MGCPKVRLVRYPRKLTWAPVATSTANRPYKGHECTLWAPSETTYKYDAVNSANYKGLFDGP